MSSERQIKCVLIGDGTVGKSCMVTTFTTGSFPQEWVPSVFENYSAQMTVDNQAVNLSLWDSSGLENYDRLRTNVYPNTDVFVFCTKLDLRDDPETIRNLQAEGKSPVTKSHGQECANQIKAVKYLECSALTQHGLSDVFNEAVRAVISPKPTKSKKRCMIM
uniref:Uncharacterized protein n=1 Tax=Acrobeloides nanus TaxID=290746 RepID=A0A914DMF1_9BILA